MKKSIFTISILIFISINLFSQSPQSFKYQAVVRDAAGLVIKNQNVGIKISILEGSISGTAIYEEEHADSTNDFGLVNLDIGTGTVLSGDFTMIVWGNNSYFVQIELDETGGTSYQLMGVSQLMSVPYALYAEKAGVSDSSLWEINMNDIYYDEGNVGIGTITPNGKLQVYSDTTANINDVIFSVLNAVGDTVFAVYQEGVRIWVSDDTTGAKATGSRGGFAVGGFNPAKSTSDEYFRVSPDSVRVYIKETIGGAKASGSRGGFAVGGFNPAKSPGDYFFNIEDLMNPETINPSEPRFLWYPQKEAVLAGRVLIEHPDSVGLNSVATGYESKAQGGWSHALGYKARTLGDFSTSIGINTFAKGTNSFAVGDEVTAVGDKSFSLGHLTTTRGIGAVALGSEEVNDIGVPTGNYTEADGDYSFAAGLGAKTTGIASVSIGVNTQATNYGSIAVGFYSQASGIQSVAFGNVATASGDFSAAIGFNVQATGISSTAFGNNVSTNGHTGSIIIGDISTIVPTNSTFDNQFMVRASGGYVFYTEPTLMEINTMYISPLTGNVGIGIATPTRKLHINDVMRLEPRATEPNPALPGDIYFDGTTQKLRVYTIPGGWINCN